MSTHKRISQREAMRLKKLVKELESRLHGLQSDYPNGTFVAQIEVPAWTHGALTMARRLGHSIVVVEKDKLTVVFRAIPKS